ncbi:acyl-CoA thioesterase/bile acid-CoA:amino acid N-acyltransferase family protein [Paenibacillus sp. JCM 10914]|uniref:acyl-CoA thioesterase/bile acid-CoA:amino acid N-acyltransferase family protein n=1 Tax=Paenibacillus sp. JCM 10914 TaxID=1236974 RepID=UPI0003CC65FA|nr:acyl-CoA thioesterase/bile acid-CoA:amino acid N-acyltransferase family protein [Paenibacillus sp. JCM 10914]GAE09756.1 cytosolic acyl coenzyme A thioester hydrolase, inducible [Paenibacillus sp. JCM 10914]
MHPAIIISRSTSMMDEPVTISAVGLQPQQTVKFHLIKKIHEDRFLASEATFIADSEGNVHLERQAPVQGSYTGVDGMGLFWSLEPLPGDQLPHGNETPSPPSIIKDELSPQNSTLLLESDHHIAAQQTIIREWLGAGICKEPVHNDEFIGTYFYPANHGPKRAILVLGGSEGGINEKTAALLASHGFSVLALGYFGTGNLNKQLSDISLEYVGKAIQWLKSRPEVAPGGIGIHGTSRGSELALWSAVLFSDITATVSLNGSAVSFCGIAPWTDQPILPPAWIYEGQPLPYLRRDNPVDLALSCKQMWGSKQGNPFRAWHGGLSADHAQRDAATIPLERINGGLLMISGEADECWDSVALSQQGFRRRTSPDQAGLSKHLIYKGAGHYIGIPYLRAIASDQGTKPDIARASIDSWKETIEFFKKML